MTAQGSTTTYRRHSVVVLMTGNKCAEVCATGSVAALASSLCVLNNIAISAHWGMQLLCSCITIMSARISNDYITVQ